MVDGRLEAIYIADRKGVELHRVETVEAAPRRGLIGDRYCRQQALAKPDQEVTLIALEALEALSREHGITLAPGQARRNLLTRGVPLNDLVGREFAIGEVCLRGLRLCEPCDHLEMLTQPGVKQGLCHRGGLRAQIVRGGLLQTGDAIQLREGLNDESI